MIASRERQHSERVAKINKYRLRVLPVTGIYGGNAAGKSNFVEALAFVKFLVVNGAGIDKPIPTDPFRLGDNDENKPSVFGFRILIRDTVYEFKFAVTPESVISEKLAIINANESETLLYARETGMGVRFGDKRYENIKFLEFVAQGTRKNQLFLTNSVSQNVSDFKDIYDWFENLTLIYPKSWFQPPVSFFANDDPLLAKISETLFDLDTGVVRVACEDADPEVAAKLIDKIQSESLPTNSPFRIPLSGVIISSKNGKPVIKKLVTYHIKADGTQKEFDISLESDGTQRAFDLIPAFLAQPEDGQGRVCVIDELDRSLHTVVTRKLLNMYLSSLSLKSRSQLIFTTHDVALMDQELFRRDELWVTERNKGGDSTLIALSEYKNVRHDKDIRKSYMLGRFGGIPRV